MHAGSSLSSYGGEGRGEEAIYSCGYSFSKSALEVIFGIFAGEIHNGQGDIHQATGAQIGFWARRVRGNGGWRFQGRGRCRLAQPIQFVTTDKQRERDPGKHNDDWISQQTWHDGEEHRKTQEQPTR